ncbi:MAG TPA: DUF4082 domain-containing protein [Nevskiaceae bacterium]|nr:DUF4082 domain-containing protein [Nevskiaceae bacterium]
MLNKLKVSRVTIGLIAIVMSLSLAVPVPQVNAISTCPIDLLSSLTPNNTNFNDPDAVSVGVKFTVRGAGRMIGVKYYKGADNYGPLGVGIWDLTSNTSNGGGSTNGSDFSSGWKTFPFVPQEEVIGGHTYLLWMHFPHGHYAADGGSAGGINSFENHGFGDEDGIISIDQGNSGVYEYTTDRTVKPTHYTTTNYWISPILKDDVAPSAPGAVTATDTAAGPAINWASPGYDANNIPSTATPAHTIITRTSSEEGAATVGVQAGGQTSWTDVPNDPTALPGRTYTYSVKNQDYCGNLSTDSSAQVSTASQSLNHIFSTNPAATDTGQTTPVTVGMRWNANTAGKVWGVRYYRTDSSTIPSSGNFKVGLWDNDGTLLASRTVPSGNAQVGWTDVRFTSPVDVDANHDYVIGYFAPNGLEAYTNNTLSSLVHDTGSSLTAVADSGTTPNGVYSLDSSFQYPSTRSSHAAWYGVDVDFYIP